MRRLLIVLGGLALAGLLAVGLVQAGGDERPAPAARREPFDLRAALRRLDGAPAPLARLHRRASTLRPATPREFRATLAGLRGHPVVVNKWASWCGPCRAEFPHFQQVATELGPEVAFLGVDAGDGTQPARAFLARYPVPYPSFEDPKEQIARAIGAPKSYPITVFFDARGERAFIKPGGYRSAADLRADIARYAR